MPRRVQKGNIRSSRSRFLLKIILKRVYLTSYTPLFALSLIGAWTRKFVVFFTFLPFKIATRLISFLRIAILVLRLRFFGKPIKILQLSTLFSIIVITLIVSLVVRQIFTNLPIPEELRNRQVQASTKIYDRNGELLYTIYKDENRTPVNLDQIPKHVIYATLAIEDADFYNHPGFSLRGITRSFFKNIREKRMTGGSTITQQLVKNTLLSPEKTLLRKLKEVVLSLQVEASFSKDEILEMYLNEVSYGNSAYGIQEAARVYFGKDVGKLTVAEAALLAGLPKSPTYYSPFGHDPTRAIARQQEVLNLMAEKSFLDVGILEQAKSEELTFSPRGVDIKAPHFVMFVREWLVEQYGEEMVEKGGLEVTTTIDLSVQKMAEEVLKEELEKLKRLNVTNGSVVIISPQTGEILAMVGSKDYFDIQGDGNVNVALRPRSPGSSIKPVTYSYALEHGFTPATIIADTPTTISMAGQPPYIPKNYDGSFRGRITLRSALAESRNIPAVKALLSVGLQNVIEHGKKMGITTWEDKNRFGPSLTLGGGEVPLIDLAQVYSVFANLGNKVPLTPVQHIKNYKGRSVYKPKCSMVNEEQCNYDQVLDPRVAYQIIDILRDNNARTPAFGSSSMLVIKDHPEVAVKTGTSNDLRDNLTIGFNKDYLTAVWVGNNDNSPMSRVASGVTGASPIWNKVMTALLHEKPSLAWDPPVGLVQHAVCIYTGTLACNGCPVKSEWFVEGTEPKFACRSEDLRKSPGPIARPDILQTGASIEN